jgi:hypothetical protein
MKVINQTFKKIGIVLLVIGIIDLAVLLFCLAKGYYYSSNFNILAIFPGIFLIRSSVKTARFMRWLSLFGGILALGMYLIVLLSKPLDLILVQLKLNTYVTLIDFVMGVFLIGVLFWVYQQLSNAESLSALAAAGYKTGKPKSAIIAGLIIVIIAGVSSYLLLTGESAKKAKKIAAERAGSHYRFHINSMEFIAEGGRAEITFYNNQQIGNMTVEW